jgi:hypothetical protein
MRGHPVFYRAECNRHILPWMPWGMASHRKGGALTDDEIGFVVNPVMGWIAGQVR